MSIYCLFLPCQAHQGTYFAWRQVLSLICFCWHEIKREWCLALARCSPEPAQTDRSISWECRCQVLLRTLLPFGRTLISGSTESLAIQAKGVLGLGGGVPEQVTSPAFLHVSFKSEINALIPKERETSFSKGFVYTPMAWCVR